MLVRLAGVIACALALTSVGATTAHAASRTFIDGPGDVWAVGGPQTNAPPSQVPAREQGDILRTTVTHAQQQLVIRTRFAELNREGQHIIFVMKLRTNTGEVRKLFVIAGRHNHWRVRTRWETPGGRIIGCATSQRIDYATNVAVLRVPRTCLSNPRTVQVAYVVATGSVRNGFGDNALAHHPRLSLIPFTAPIRHG